MSKVLKKNDISTRYKSVDDKGNIYKEKTLLNFSFEKIANNHKISVSEAKKEFRKQRDKKIIKDYKNKTIDEICIKYNLSNMAIYKILDKYNISRKSPKKTKREFIKPEKINREVVIEDYNAKVLSINEILKKHNISKSQLYSIVYKYNLPLRSNSSIKSEIKQSVINDFKSGMTRTAISQKYKISRNLITNILRGENNEHNS